MVSKDTVDDDIFAMQQRKAKMNAAIMDSDPEWNKRTNNDKQIVLKTAVDRFLMSPSATTRRSTPVVLEEKNGQNDGHLENL